jgi:putative PIN family toxin of toxin-antitoxin system
MRVLLDTNVLAASMAGHLSESSGPPAQLWSQWQAEQFDLIISAHLLDELERTLTTPWFRERSTPDAFYELMHYLRRYAIFVDASNDVVGIASHWHDDLILAAAVSGNADFLVTGDAEFLRVREYQGVRLCTPAQFLRELDARSA